MDGFLWTYSHENGASINLACSRNGIVALYSRKNLFTYKIINNNSDISSFYCSQKLNSDITCAAWCRAYKQESLIPDILFLAFKDGNSCFIDFSDNTIIAKYSVTGTYFTQCTWSRDYINQLFLGTADGRIFNILLTKSNELSDTLMSISKMWSTQYDFSIDFLDIDENNHNSLIVGSKKGEIRILNNIYETNPICLISVDTIKDKDKCELANCGFLSHARESFFVLSTKKILFGYIKDRCIFAPKFSTNFSEMLGIFQPTYCTHLLAIIQRNSICLTKVNESSEWETIHEIQIKDIGTFQPIDERTFIISSLTHELMLIKIYKEKLFVASLYQSIPDQPTHLIASNDDFVSITFKDGNINLFQNTISNIIPKKRINLYIEQITTINQTEFISNTQMVISCTTINEHHKIYFIDFETMEIISLLKPQIESLSAKPIKIIPQQQGKYFILEIEPFLLLFYMIQKGSKPELFKHFLLPRKCSTYFTCDGNVIFFLRNVIQIISLPNFEVQQNILIQSIKGEPLTIIQFGCGTYLCTSTIGEIYYIDSEKMSLISNSNNKIKSIISSQDWFSCVIMFDSGSPLLCKTDENGNITTNQIKYQFKNLAFLTNEIVIALVKGMSSFVLFQFPTFEPIRNNFKKSEYLSFDKFKEIISNDLSIKNVYENAKKFDLFYIADRIKPFIKDSFDFSAYGVNVNNELFLKHLNEMILVGDSLEFISRKIRLMKVVGKDDDAFSVLFSTPSNNEKFTQNILKAGLVSAKLDEKSVMLAVGSLINSEKFEDAIDILHLVNDYFEAAKHLLSVNDIEGALVLFKTKLTNDEKERLTSKLIDTLNYMKMKDQTYAILAALGYTEMALKELRNMGENRAADLIESIKFE